MNNVIRLRPVHFDIRSAWLRDIPKIKDNPDLVRALLALYQEWVAFAEFKRDEEAPADEERAENEFDLDLLIGMQKIFDWSWVISKFHPDQVVVAQLALCQSVAPEHEWEIVESDDHSVVANADRTLVADLMLCDQLSASASLLYAGEEAFGSDPAVDRELCEFIEKKTEVLQAAVERARQHLAQADFSAEITSLRPEAGDEEEG